MTGDAKGPSVHPEYRVQHYDPDLGWYGWSAHFTDEAQARRYFDAEVARAPQDGWRMVTRDCTPLVPVATHSPGTKDRS